MKIIIDAMGGDNAPGEIVKGAVEAAGRTDSKIVLVGDQAKIEQCLKNCQANPRTMEIVHTEETISMEDDPLSILRAKKNSSMGMGLRMLKEDGDAFISAGNTGALHAGSSLIIRPVKGLQRSAIATVLPFQRPCLLMDCGANVTVTADYLEQWAIIGSLYMEYVLKVKNPEVGLLNNGTEECKGTPVQVDAFQKLKQNEAIRFAGNIEGKEIPSGLCDVLVTDGFTGNITLKMLEGMAKFLFGQLKGMYTRNVMTKVSFLVMKDSLKDLKKSFDASEYGGAPLLGLQKPVIKAHGSSDARAIMNAVRQAEAFVKTGVIQEMETHMKKYDRSVLRNKPAEEGQKESE
ncbi:MAG: phosphate acyltransferase PlsX [Ruminococcaceae bacterium]|nr:phosphate acyltransferase PlsX [Oscillospiraceae bacterium]